MDNDFYKGKIIVSSSLKHFFNLNPPCKECLIQNMCIHIESFFTTENHFAADDPYLLITVCEKLLTFFKTTDKMKVPDKELKKIENIMRGKNGYGL